MQFDLIIGNPPYQHNTGRGGQGNHATPLYHHFIEQAKQLNPKYITMVVPSRWFAGGIGLSKFREDMINDKRISHIIDYPGEKDVFPCVLIRGGVCYFVWDKDKTDKDCEFTIKRNNKPDNKLVRPLKIEGVDILIRNNDAINIVNKFKNVKSFKDIIMRAGPTFGVCSDYHIESKKTDKNNITLYRSRGIDYISKEAVMKNHKYISKYKVFKGSVAGGPYLGKPNVLSTGTYYVFGIYDDYETAYNVCTYMITRFFRFLVSLSKISIHTATRCYQFVPIVDFTKPWTDEELYKMFNLDKNEIELIESTIKPMESNFKNPYEDKQ